jgi:glucose-1-phosphate cytidylyltransferase
MKVILLAGGLGTRISEETSDKPKPMVLIDDKPIIWHLMNIFATQGHREFVIAGGYKFEVIQDWVASTNFDWDVEVLDTGLNTQTGGRIKQCIERYEDHEFLASYGDGLGNVNLSKLLHFHKSHNKLATVTAVHPPARFGVLEIDGGQVMHFGEKIQAGSGWINGGFFALNRLVSNYIEADSEPFEIGALPRLVKENQLMAFEHSGFWQPMDTLRERQELSVLSKKMLPPWLTEIGSANA